MLIFIVWLLSFIPLGTFLYSIGKATNVPTYLECKLVAQSFAETDTSTLPLPILKPKGNYKEIKRRIEIKQKKFQEAYQLADNEVYKREIVHQAGVYITKELLNGLFPHWYGTTWAFDGYSATPQKGTIGCSYFVSTTLLHAGFNLNRYQLAQQGPVSEARSLAIDSIPLPIDLMGNFNRFDTIIEQTCGEGLYFIGLGHSHVGYLFYREGEIYFIQSSYGKSGAVVIDYANESDVLTTFSDFTLVPITTNYLLIQHWLMGEEITIVKGTE